MQALASLAVVGAGPKGLAIAAKRAALARTGREEPDLVLIDRAGVATNWVTIAAIGRHHRREPMRSPGAVDESGTTRAPPPSLRRRTAGSSRRPGGSVRAWTNSSSSRVSS
jgi:hypothetical protein